MSRIYLIGFMGAGKTTIGKMVSEATGFQFVDTDCYIEQKNNQSVAEIFLKEGESFFRELERNILHEISQSDNIVVATGGGTPCFFDNMYYMNYLGITIYLDLTPDELLNQLLEDKIDTRPLLKGKTREELQLFIKEQLNNRLCFYRQAKLSLKGSIQHKTDEIVRLIKNN